MLNDLKIQGLKDDAKSSKEKIANMESIGKQHIMVGEQEKELIGLKRIGIKIGD